MKATLGGVTTTYIGNTFKYMNSSTTKKYYYAGGQRVAMRSNSTLYFLLGDHLGSTSVTANSSGGKVAELRYYPWGGTRYTSGATPTSYQYTPRLRSGPARPAPRRSPFVMTQPATAWQ